MNLTRFHLQTILNRRLGPWAALADLDDAAGFSLRQLGIEPASPAAVVDADFSTVVSGQMNALLDVAEWRMLWAILNNLSAEELARIGVTEDADKVAARLRARLDRLGAYVRDAYGMGLPTLVVGVVDLGTSQADDPSNPPINY